MKLTIILLVVLLAGCGAARPTPVRFAGRRALLAKDIIGKGALGLPAQPAQPAETRTINPIGFGEGYAGVSLGTKTIPGFSFTTGGGSFTQGSVNVVGTTTYIAHGKGSLPKTVPGKVEIQGGEWVKGPTVLQGTPGAAPTPTIIHFKPGYGPAGKLAPFAKGAAPAAGASAAAPAFEPEAEAPAAANPAPAAPKH